MATYNPPTEDVPIFDSTLFNTDGAFLTASAGDLRYLKYPVAQGKETLQEIDVYGQAKFISTTIACPGTEIYWPNPAPADPNFGYQQYMGAESVMVLKNILPNGILHTSGSIKLAKCNNQTLSLMGWQMDDSMATSLYKCYLGYNSNIQGFTFYDDDGIFTFNNELTANPPTPKVWIQDNPTAALAIDTTFGEIVFGSRNGNSRGIGATIKAVSSVLWSTGQHGSHIVFSTCSNTTTTLTQKASLSANGFFGIGSIIASYPLTVGATNGANPMVMVNAGSTVTNLASLFLHNDLSTTGTTYQSFGMCMAKASGQFALNTLAGDCILRCNNLSGTTTNRLMLSANSATVSPCIDVDNKLRVGTETSLPVGLGNIAVQANTGSIPCISVRGNPSAATIGGRIDFHAPNAGGNIMRIYTTGTTDATILSTVIGGTLTLGGMNLASSAVNAYDCGTATLFWRNVKAQNAFITASDERKKTDIKTIPLGLNFINKLKPVSYKWKETNDVVGEAIVPTPGVREHFGLIAQDVKKTLDEEGIDASLWCLADKDDINSQQALRYSELISPMIKAIQEMSKTIQEITEMNKSLMARIAVLEAKK